jgi:DNA mismatch repair protein MutS
MADDTPMMRQYAQIKREHRDAILFFRLGDFYEMFQEDAHEASRILGLTLTQRNGTPMCGIPYHASHGYVGRLLKAGKKIAICEQTRMPDGKGLAERGVVEIITPGTATDEDYLDTRSNSYLLSIGPAGDPDNGEIAFSWVDLSTGEFATTSVSMRTRAEGTRRILARLRPREILVPESLVEEDRELGRVISEQNDIMVNRFPDWSYDRETGRVRIQELLGVVNLRGFGLSENSPHLAACGVLVQYIEETARSLLPHIRTVRVEREDEFVSLDESTQKNLELIQNMHDGGRKFALLSVLDQTRTPMGARMLKRWLLTPLKSPEAILRRQDVVESLYHDQLRLGELRSALSRMLDLERLSARVAMERAHGKDLAAIAATLSAALGVSRLMQDGALDGFSMTPEEEQTIRSIVGLLERAIAENPSVVLTEGNLIRPGFDEKLDELRDLQRNSRKVLDAYLREEQARSGIQNLRIKYNKIIGHYLEVSKGNLGFVPEHFIRRQTLVGGDRFTTERLGEIESGLNSASERIVETERELFLGVRAQTREQLSELLETCRRIAELDCLQGFAYAATLYGYTRPVVSDDVRISIVAGRHPVVEANIPAGTFVPNDLELVAEAEDTATSSFALITGPNMAGKSTFLRQTALIALMAQIGSFVPAQEARIGIVDKIFCRVGASDNLARGESTFLVEMNETAFILRSATAKSLVIMDEVGRGTSTNDGLAIAWAVSEHILDTIGCRTLFATHYHELTALHHAGLFNLSLSVNEQGGEIVFLKKVQHGPSSNSYGIQVARLAGLPPGVIDRSNELLVALQESREGTRPKHDLRKPSTPKGGRPKGAASQQDLFAGSDMVAQDILSLDIARTPPLDALNRIARWQELLRKDRG